MRAGNDKYRHSQARFGVPVLVAAVIGGLLIGALIMSANLAPVALDGSGSYTAEQYLAKTGADVKEIAKAAASATADAATAAKQMVSAADKLATSAGRGAGAPFDVPPNRAPWPISKPMPRVPDREVLAQTLDTMGLNGIWVELGVRLGNFSESLLEHGKCDVLYSVDMWAGDRGHDMGEFQTTVNRIRRFGARSIPVRATFQEAIPLFQENSVDFIYWDGYAHTGQNGGETMDAYWRILKMGGVFAGHDYTTHFKANKDVVDAFAERIGLELMVIPTPPGPGMFASWAIRKVPGKWQSIPSLTRKPSAADNE